MRCVNLWWTKYNVTDGLGVKLHALPLGAGACVSGCVRGWVGVNWVNLCSF